MELKSGFKKTEIGVIPSDWDAVQLDRVARRGSGHTPDKKHPEYWNGTIKWISLADSQALDQLYIDDTFAKITDEGIENSSAVLHQTGTVVLSRDAGVGKSAILRTDMAVSQHFMAWRCGPRLDNRYLYYWLQSAKPEFERIANGNTIKTIGLPYFRALRIPFPDVGEQRAIAAALSDVDALIGALNKLIAKKRDIKQAAMQQLLTGQTRPPGFGGEWKKMRLSEVGEISGAGVDKTAKPSETPVRLVNYLDVYRKDFLFAKDLTHWVTAPTHQLNRCAVKQGDIFFTPSSETRDDIGLSAVAMEDIPDAAYSYHVVRLRLRDKWDLRFRTYAFKTKTFLDQAERLCDGSGTRYVISLGKFKEMTVLVPSFAEQIAISTVLFDMDAELAALEARRDKTRALKQGMMQELLTGRIRLLPPTAQPSPG